MLGKDYHPMLAAVDRAGNVRKEAVDISRVHVDFRKDNINIDQAFLEKKSAEFTAMYPGEMSDFERFLKINGDVRKSNADKLLELGKDTSADILWNGAFLRLPRSASRADFADHRTYFFEGTRIDEQVHLGFDLASVVQAPVPAANAGRVIFSGYLGIYGNLVVIDHGLGLQSLYSHLTVAQVQKDQLVKKGEIIGATGATGMAGGDHLHFGILISGLEVSPQEWLDARWVKNNIADRVLAAGGVMPDVVEIPPASPPPAKQQPPARKRPRRR